MFIHLSWRIRFGGAIRDPGGTKNYRFDSQAPSTLDLEIGQMEVVDGE